VEFCTVVRLKMNSHAIILGAEIDCFDAKPPIHNSKVTQLPGLDSYVELKTFKMIDSDKADWNWRRYKLLRFWIQSFLVGVPSIVCGFKNDKGIVQKVQTIPTTTIPKMCKKWDPWICLNFADQLLCWLSKNTKDEENYSLRFTSPFTTVQLYKKTTVSEVLT